MATKRNPLVIIPNGAPTIRRQPPKSRTRRQSNDVARLIKSASTSAAGEWHVRNSRLLQSPNAELRKHLDAARELAREVVAKSGYAQKYIELCATYVVGADGLTIDPRITNPDGSLNVEVNTTITNAWNEWCERCSYDGERSFVEIEASAVREVARDGEIILQLVHGKKAGKFGFALVQVDISQLDTNYNGRIDENHYVQMGIEFADERRNRTAYYIWSSLPEDASSSGKAGRRRERIDAADILHVYDPIGTEIRGLSWLSSVQLTIAHLWAYQYSHLLAMQVAASVPLVLSNSLPATPDTTTTDVAVDGSTPVMGNHAPAINLAFQQILETPAGQELKALTLPFPQTGFDMATKEYLQQICAGLHISYATLTSDSQNEAWSTVKHQSVIERDHWKSIVAMFKRRFHKRIYRQWLENAMLVGALDLPGEPEDYYNVDFRSRGYQDADPRKSVDAALKAISEGLTTRTQLCIEGGTDYEENIKTLAREQEIALQHGVMLTSVPTNVATDHALPVTSNE